MGSCVSTVTPDNPGKERSDEIDRELEEDSKRMKRERTILLLGSGRSGRSTILKQLKLMTQDGFSETELMEFRDIIHRDILDSAKQIMDCMSREGLECVEYSNRALAKKILDYRFEPQDAANMVLSTEIAEAIHHVVKDPIFPRVMDEHASDIYIMDSASYFLGEVSRIGAPGYVPNMTDVMKVKTKTMGITLLRFNMGQLLIRIVDVNGQRSERKKWIHYFESVTSIMFCVGLPEYDQFLFDDESQMGLNCLHLSINLFDSVINSRWFLRVSIILLLNKIDLFRAKLPKAPLQRYFPQYTGGNDISKAAKYILWKFMQTNRARLSIYPHVTQATDTASFRYVFRAIKETMLQNSINDSGIL